MSSCLSVCLLACLPACLPALLRTMPTAAARAGPRLLLLLMPMLVPVLVLLLLLPLLLWPRCGGRQLDLDSGRAGWWTTFHVPLVLGAFPWTARSGFIPGRTTLLSEARLSAAHCQSGELEGTKGLGNEGARVPAGGKSPPQIFLYSLDITGPKDK